MSDACARSRGTCVTTPAGSGLSKGESAVTGIRRRSARPRAGEFPEERTGGRRAGGSELPDAASRARPDAAAAAALIISSSGDDAGASAGAGAGAAGSGTAACSVSNA
jgi:hypothetical protein